MLECVSILLGRYGCFLRISCTNAWPLCGFWGGSCDTSTLLRWQGEGRSSELLDERKDIGMNTSTTDQLYYLSFVLHLRNFKADTLYLHFRSSLRFAYTKRHWLFFHWVILPFYKGSQSAAAIEKSHQRHPIEDMLVFIFAEWVEMLMFDNGHSSNPSHAHFI